MVRGQLEWILPPLRFEALGSPGFYASWVRTQLFATALGTDLNDATHRAHAYDVGAQLDVQLHVMFRWPMMLATGIARGFGGTGATTEFMLSLQVL